LVFGPAIMQHDAREADPRPAAPRIGPPVLAAARRWIPVPRLGAMRIRKKLLFLHTCFSAALALILFSAVQPAGRAAVREAETDKAVSLLQAVASPDAAVAPTHSLVRERLRLLASLPNVIVRTGSASEVGIDTATAARAASRRGQPIPVEEGPGDPAGGARAALFSAEGDGAAFFTVVIVKVPEARRAVRLLYAATILSVLAVYALIVLSLEVFVLPRHVYRPIDRLLEADQALREGRREAELVPPEAIPSDELGAIMRSRNESVTALRSHQEALDDALRRIEQVAAELKRKNHLLETARTNLAHSDRLASLGVMSAGIAHELNTPLAVLKGLAEQIDADPDRPVEPQRAALMLRVVRRLERLSESLLHFARVRPPRTRPADAAALADEALTLVRLDRGAADVDLVNRVPGGLIVACDADRIVQVLVNLVRNAVDAIRGRPAPRPGEGHRGLVVVDAETSVRDGREWLSLTIADNGPGIDPSVIPKLFEPFVSSKLDARGTGLGLAVADGIVREHDGVIIARNRDLSDGGGAVFEIMLPVGSAPRSPEQPAPAQEAANA
jgi:signal transduction histidine kinase